MYLKFVLSRIINSSTKQQLFRIPPSPNSRTLSSQKMSGDDYPPGPIETAIKETLTTNLSPVHLEVINESKYHNAPKGSESHFKVLVVSEKFTNVPLIKRHRLINDLVKTKLESDFVHALSIEAKTPTQWDEQYKVSPSPNCKGGFGK